MDLDTIKKEFELRLEELRKQILEASIHFNIWQDLWPTEEKVEVINRFKGFFQPARIAHRDRFIILMSNIFSTKNKAPSFYNIFRMLKNERQIIQGLDIKSLSKRLKQHRKTKEAIIAFRNEVAAHHEVEWPSTEIPERKPVLFGETKIMLLDIQEMYNEISSLYSRNLWSFTPLEHQHTNNLLVELDDMKKIRQILRRP